jgi:hypothetical protein
MGPDVFNKETGIYRAYHLDFYIDVGPAVSLLLYAKGDAGLPNYAPDFFPQPLGANLMGEWRPPYPWAKFTDCSWP